MARSRTTAFYAAFLMRSGHRRRFLWPFWVPQDKKPHKMRLICYFSTASSIKINTHSDRKSFRKLEEDSWQQD